MVDPKTTGKEGKSWKFTPDGAMLSPTPASKQVLYATLVLHHVMASRGASKWQGTK